jgi:outer membrane lipoprotein-sorting protein
MKIIISLYLLLYTSFAFSQNANDVLKSLQNKFNSITNLSADISQRVNDKTNLSGKMFFKKENSLRIEFANQTIVTDGKTSWNYDKKTNKVIISNYDETGSGLLSINYIVYQYPSECELSLSSKGSEQILVLNPKSKRNTFGQVMLFITKDNLIAKAVISGHGSGTIEVTFSNYKLNQILADSKFSFTAPEGTTIVDLR